jgi:hypothetical protein
VFRNLGSLLFTVAAEAADEEALSEALTEAARSSRGQERSLAETAAIFVELGRLGPDERQAATSILTAFLRYAAASRGAR